MNLQVEWDDPISLEYVNNEKLIYSCNPELLPEDPGIYVFARRFGESHSPIYVGKASNLRKRITDHFYKNVPLMRGLENADKGARIVLIGKWISKPGQQMNNALSTLEKAYIESALTLGYELLNVKGARRPIDKIESVGKRKSHFPFPRRMNIER
ncbi:hypothetical protein ACN28I_22915 [Archangium gephyra]|uniref:hypothetical protein n=1 Tax=Archangium gephyra TaxID=48 RepID=UPI003B77A148